jgi:hypothetical protein
MRVKLACFREHKTLFAFLKPTNLACFCKHGYTLVRDKHSSLLDQFISYKESEVFSGLCYNPITIVNDDARVVNKLETRRHLRSSHALQYRPLNIVSEL